MPQLVQPKQERVVAAEPDKQKAKPKQKQAGPSIQLVSTSTLSQTAVLCLADEGKVVQGKLIQGPDGMWIAVAGDHQVATGIPCLAPVLEGAEPEDSEQEENHRYCAQESKEEEGQAQESKEEEHQEQENHEHERCRSRATRSRR